MKKISIVLAGFLLLSASSKVLAHEHHSASAQSERNSAIMSFAIMGVVSAAIHKGSALMNVGGATQGILHTANVLYNLGEIADKPVLKDLGSRALLAGAAAKIASTDSFKTGFVPWIPFIGESLNAAGGMGVGVTTVALYSALGQAYERAKEYTGLGKLLGLS